MARLSQAPVFFTLAQMRFNAFLELAPVLPALQDAFRKAGYPDYEMPRVSGLEVQQDDDGITVSTSPVTRHVFRNKNRTSAILLDPAALTYELTDYPDREEFIAAFLKALEITHAHRPIEYCDRLGMRMLDAIQPIEGESLGQYVAPETLGFASLMGDDVEVQHSSTESLLRLGNRAMIMRTIRVPRGIAAPPDLAPMRLSVNRRFLDYPREALILDVDCFQTERVDFSLDTTETDLVALKDALTRAFKTVVTDHALEVWR